MKEAAKSLEENTYPVGAVIADESGNVIATGRNHVNPLQDITAHAEIDALRNAGKSILDAKLRKEKLTLYTTLEPCPMCTGAILFAHIHRVVWILNDETGFGGFRVIQESKVYESRFAKIETIAEPFDDLKEIQLELMDSWSKNPYNIANQRKAGVSLR
ncbi:nucleoside deaminase [Chungangia koreensis]|uniref:Nucleoside deaminase n=1 Tax=Chungangia koreensis TaxID=752657 RepID=A0ABV8X3D4_9LACT